MTHQCILCGGPSRSGFDVCGRCDTQPEYMERSGPEQTEPEPPEPLPMAVRVLEDVASAAEGAARYVRERATRLTPELVAQATEDSETARQCREALKRLGG